MPASPMLVDVQVPELVERVSLEAAGVECEDAYTAPRISAG